MPQPEWFGPMDKLSWQLGQMALLFDLLLAFGVCLLAMAAAALIVQLIGLRQLMRAEKPKGKGALPRPLPATEKNQSIHFRPAAVRTARGATVRRKSI